VRRSGIAHAAPEDVHESPLDLPTRAGRGLLHVVVDTPHGSGNKYKFEPERG
jgi:hypothetical protein